MDERITMLDFVDKCSKSNVVYRCFQVGNRQ